MKEHIERKAVCNDCDNLKICVDKSLCPVGRASAADVVERKRGEWEDEYGGAFANPRYRCSVCKEKALYRHEQDCLGGWHEVQALTDFCPHCNADLRSHHDSLCDQTEEGEHEAD